MFDIKAVVGIFRGNGNK
jgi:hypothetical protein